MQKARPAENVNWTNVDIREKVQKSRRFAAAVQQALFGVLASQIPDMRNRGVKKASYVVLTGTSMPAILAEVSFVSSPEDEEKLKSSSYRAEDRGRIVQRNRTVRRHLARRECRQRSQQAIRDL